MVIKNNFDYYPHEDIGLIIEPNYETLNDKAATDKMVNQFSIARMDYATIADLNIIGKSPLVNKLVWIGRF